MSVQLPISGDSAQPESGRGEGPANGSAVALSTGGKVRYFGGYELLAEIARGGMGVVYKARQLSLNRLVALKMILSGPLATEQEARRFRLEAEAVASLDHPNILPIYEIGEYEGRQYFSMRLIEGENLVHHVAGFKQDLRAAAKFMVTVARAVHHAHQHGILHRDLKPANILVDPEGQPHVTDFGLARRLEQDSGLTQTGSAIGTPNYMSPEQALGKVKQLTTASDVFSLGAILYEMVTGEAPFRAETPLRTAKLVVEAEPRRPSLGNSRIDADLETICLKCLEKDPKRRYETPRYMAEDLERWLRQEPIVARPVGTVARAGKWIRREPTIAAVIGLSVVGLLGFVAILMVDQARLQRERDAATVARDETEVRLAAELLSEGEALSAKHHLPQAKDCIRKALQIYTDRKISKLPAEISLLDTYRFSPPPLLTLRGHHSNVTCVAVSPDQHTIISGGVDGTIRVWSCPLGRQEAVWDAHTGGVKSLALSPDGVWCVSGGNDGRIKIWDVRQASLVTTFVGHTSSVVSVAFPRKGDAFASVGGDGAIRIWQGTSGKLVQELDMGPGEITAMAFSPDGRQIAVGGPSAALTIWSLDDTTRPKEYNLGQIPGKNCLCLAYSPDGRSVVFGNSRGRLLSYDVKDGVRRDYVDMVESTATALAFFSDGKRLLSGGRNGTISVWRLDGESGDPVAMLSDHQGVVSALATFADGRLAVSAGEDGTIRVWDTAPNEGARTSSPYYLIHGRAAFSPDGLLLVTGGKSGELRVWDFATGQVLRNLEGHSEIVFDAAFSPDGRQVASGGQDRTVRLWDITNGKELRQFSAESMVRCVAFSSDGQQVVAGEGLFEGWSAPPQAARASRLHVWQAASGQALGSFVAHTNGIFTLAVAPAGRRVLSGGGDGKIRLWDATTWKEIRSFEGDELSVHSVAFTHDGARFVSGGTAQHFRAREIATGRDIRFFPGARDDVDCVATSADGSLLMGGMSNGDIALWNLATGKLLHSWQGVHLTGISGLAFAPNAQMAVSAAEDILIKVWDFGRAASYRDLDLAAGRAREVLQDHPQDPSALVSLGQWYQLREVWGWAAEVLQRARSQGGAVEYLSLARCYWQGHRLEEAGQAMELAAKRGEAPDYYLRLCRQAIDSQIIRGKAKSRLAPTMPADAIVLQPGPADEKDIYTTSVFSNAPGGDTPGGGNNGPCLRVGGWADLYYTLLQFNLTGCPTNAASAALHLYCFQADGGGITMYLDRITQAWDWKTSGTGRDRERLWWADKPACSQWRNDPLPPPIEGQWYVVDLTDLYQAWQSGSWPNYGIQLRCLPHSNKKFNQFHSANYTNDPSLRPKLVIMPKP